MTDREMVKKALECCMRENNTICLCGECPYHTESSMFNCMQNVMRDALALLKHYDYALKLMVLQYCVDRDEGKYFYNQFMSAGEEAFLVLGIENGQSVDDVERTIYA